ncbi:hypothetical protein G6F43_010826 [Rhizopus delemar]|nr:hypothetical protein G6F43_010826 [Rhizopus delemar]
MFNYNKINFRNNKITIVNNGKRENSSDLSDSSISSVEVKGSKKINCFLGDGNKEWKLKEEFIVDNINISKELKRFRKLSIAEFERNKDINCLRILALSHILPINEFDASRSIIKYLDNDARRALKQVISTAKPKVRLGPAKAVLYCRSKANGAADEDDEADEKNDDVTMMCMVKDIAVQLKQNRASIATTSEATFTEKDLVSIVRRVFLEDVSEEAIYAVIDKHEKFGKKPDFMIGAKVKRREVYFFYVEVKRPGAHSKYQPEDDYTKLMKLMKKSVDDQLYLGLKDLMSLGLLIEGFKCTLFQMKLLADGIYMPMAFDRFSLVEEDHQLALLPSVVDAFYFSELRKFVEEEANKKRTTEERRAGRERIYPSFVTNFVSKKGK